MRKPYLLVVALAACTLTPSRSARADFPDFSMRVGIPQSFFYDLTDAQVKLLTEPLTEVMKDVIGMPGTPCTGGDAFTVARKLHEKKYMMAVFYGPEFAQVRSKYPELQPLLVATDGGKHESRAYVLVHKDSPIHSFADLKGKRLAIPSRTKQPARMFLDQLALIEGYKSGCKGFTCEMPKCGNIETSLNELAMQKVDAVVVDTFGLNFYKDLQPGMFARMRVVATSEVFPPIVIAYNPASVPASAIKVISNGLRESCKTDIGQELLKLWRIESFAEVPHNYEQTLSATLKAYPMLAAH